MLGRLRCAQVGLSSMAAKAPMPVYDGSQCSYHASMVLWRRRDSEKGNSKKKRASSVSDEEAAELIDVDEFKGQLERSLERLRNDFVRSLNIRTSIGSIESLVVSFEGQKYRMNEIAQVVRKNPGLVILNMSATPAAIPSVLATIAVSGMNLNPQQDGTTISVPLPQVTREHRENLVKNAKALFSRTKEDMRETQNRYVKEAKLKKGQVSDDLIFSVQQHVTAITDDRIAEAETILQKKQAELIP